jgi:hypothetical protein
MAVTAQKSDLLTNLAAVPVVLNDLDKAGGSVHSKVFSFTQVGAGDAGSTADLCDIPAGARVLEEISFVKHSAFGAAAILDIGFKTYTKADGTSVTGVADKFLDGADVAASGTKYLGTGTNAAPVSYKVDEAVKEGFVTVQAKETTAGIPNGATIDGILFYVV